MIQLVMDLIYRIFFGSDKDANWFNEPVAELRADKISTSAMEDMFEDPDVEMIKHIPIRFPVDIADVTSKFGWRKIPYRKRHFHKGTDYTGRNEYSKAPCNCIVKKVLQPDTKYPCRFIWKDEGWLKVNVPRGRAWTPYVILVACHNHKIRFVHRHGKALVKVGQVVPYGRNITKIGSYGYSQGSHLHDEYKVKLLGKWIRKNPDKFYRENS